MKLAEYLEMHPGGIEAFAEALGVDVNSVYRYCHPGKSWGRRPNPDIMRRIMEVSRGAVEPNDFYLESA